MRRPLNRLTYFICLAALTPVLLTPTFSLATDLEELVVTASRIDQPLASVSSNISRIDGETLARINATHINEAMQRIAGAWISRGNGQENLTSLRSPVLTGAGGCGAFLTAQDGIPLRASGFCNVNELFDAHSEQAGGIEVIKGPAGVVYGANAMHGLINILTPTIDAPRGVSIEAGPDDYYRTNVAYGGDKWRADFNGTTDGGYKDDSGFDQQKLSIKTQSDWQGFSITGGLSLTNLNQETAGFIQGPKVYKDSNLATENPNPEAYRDSQSARIHARLERQFDAGTLILTPYARDTEMTFLQHFLPGQAIEENGHQSFGLQSAWHQNNWLVGVDLETTDAYLREFQPGPTISGSAFLVATIPAGEHYDYDVDASTQALFGRYQLPLGDATVISAGARWERVNYDYDNKLLDGRSRDDGTACGFGGCRFSRPADREDTFTQVSSQLGLTHRLTEDQQLYINLARGFRAPQATELYRLQNTQQAADIDVEKLDSIEVGLRANPGDWSFDVSLYAMKKDNFIFRDNDRNNVDNGKTTHRGIEATVGFELTDDVSANLFWTYARHQYANNPALSANLIDGNDIDTAPRNMGSGNIQWRMSSTSQAELEWVHMGEYFQDPENQHTYSGHNLINLRVSYNINQDWQLFGRVMNLTNTAYAERADFAFGNDRYFVGQPISLYLGVRAGL